MPIGDRYTPHGPSWTVDTFLAAIASVEDKARAIHIFESLESNASSYYWFGQKPGGAVFPHPRGLRYAPMSLSVDESGVLSGQGAWKRYPGIRNDEGFAELAAFVGQDHEGTASKFVISEFDVVKLWDIADQCADRINGVGW
jgi:hypothetical protein